MNVAEMTQKMQSAIPISIELKRDYVYLQALRNLLGVSFARSLSSFLY